MDDHGFDRLTRTVATRPTRRGFLGAAAVGLGGLLGLARASGVGAISPREYCETVLGGTYQETTSQKGSFNSSHPREEEDCVNNRGGSHCK
jgi:hypothetical protein